jgi:hypothetical protein
VFYGDEEDAPKKKKSIKKMMVAVDIDTRMLPRRERANLTVVATGKQKRGPNSQVDYVEWSH